MKDISYYKRVLKIEGMYDEASLKKAFYNAVKANHPDKFKNPINKKLATEKMKLINEAYEYLKKHINDQQENNTYSDRKTSYQKTNSNNNESKKESEHKSEYNNSYSNNSSKSTDNNNETNIVEQLKKHIANHEIIRVLYIKKDGYKTTFEILPLELVKGLYKTDKMYLKAMVLSENKIKTFRTDRILKITVPEDDLKYNNYEDTNEENPSDTKTYQTGGNKDIWNITVLLPIITGIVILLSFMRMPYSFYLTLRVLVCLTLLNMAITLRNYLPQGIMALCIIGIIVYNPIIPVHLTRHIWQILNILVLLGIVNLLNGYFKDS